MCKEKRYVYLTQENPTKYEETVKEVVRSIQNQRILQAEKFKKAKPIIRKIDANKWQCQYDNSYQIGFTAKDAYENWVLIPIITREIGDPRLTIGMRNEEIAKIKWSTFIQL